MFNRKTEKSFALFAAPKNEAKEFARQVYASTGSSGFTSLMTYYLPMLALAAVMNAMLGGVKADFTGLAIQTDAAPDPVNCADQSYCISGSVVNAAGQMIVKFTEAVTAATSSSSGPNLGAQWWLS